MLTAKELIGTIAVATATGDDAAKGLRIRLAEYVDGAGKHNWTSTPLGHTAPKQFEAYGGIISRMHDLHPIVDWSEVPLPPGRNLRELIVAVADFVQVD